MDFEREVRGLLETLYANISGRAGEERDWAREREILHPSARLMRTGLDEQGHPWIRAMSLQEYIADTAEFFGSENFYETSVSFRAERFGNVAQVRSVYEAQREPGGVPWKRGVNFLQLFHDGSTWRVMGILWDNERPAVGSRSEVRVPESWLD